MKRRNYSRRMWTKEEEDYLRENYSRPDLLVADMAEHLGRKIWGVYLHARAMGLNCSPEKSRASGRANSAKPGSVAHRFQKGHVPQNKGRSMPPEVYEKVSRTMFKPGGVPANHREVGDERVNVDGYREVKVAEPNRWRLKHRVVWEQHNGPIPGGTIVTFRDGDPLNCDIDNLYTITRAEQLTQRNAYYARYPEPLVELIRAKAAVKRQITLHNKKKNKK